MCAVTAAALLTGCSQPPQVAPDHWRRMESLRTAVSAKRTDWLEANAKLIDKDHADGKLDDQQYAEFQTIIEAARKGEWDAADKEALRFEKAQRSQ